MTIQQALDKLIAASPAQSSWLVAVDVWSHWHAFDGSRETDIKWRVYNAETRNAWYSRTLESAVAAALAGSGSLDEVEAARHET